MMNDELLKSIEHVTDIGHRLLGPLAEEFGQIFADKARVYRARNFVATLQKTQKILSEAGVQPNSVPPRLLLPIIDASSVEDNETLQQMWATLLASASHQTDSISPSFVETLKQLTPEEARCLEQLRRIAMKHRKSDHLTADVLLPTDREIFGNDDTQVPWDTYERLSLVRRDYEVEAQLIESDYGTAGRVETTMGYWFVFTSYGVRFLDACCGPAKT